MATSNGPSLIPVGELDWYHGSPLKISVLRAGGSLSYFREVAEAFSHKPPSLNMEIRLDDSKARVICRVRHNGKKQGYLYRVKVPDPPADLRVHPDAGVPPGWEMLSVRELELQPLGDLPLRESYEGVYRLEDLSPAVQEWLRAEPGQ